MFDRVAVMLLWWLYGVGGWMVGLSLPLARGHDKLRRPFRHSSAAPELLSIHVGNQMASRWGHRLVR